MTKKKIPGNLIQSFFRRIAIKKFFETPSFKDLLFKSPEFWALNALPRYIGDYLRDFTMLEVEGLENVPRSGRAMLVPNHSGLFGWDAVVLQNEIFREKKRIPRTMAHAFWESTPFLKQMSSKFGFFKTDFKQAVKLLKKNKLMIIFPEAEHGNFKPSYKMYQLADFNPGFVALAIMTHTPVVPVVILGAEENYINLGTVDWFEKWIGARVPIPLNLLPLPSKWKIKFLKPISFSKYNRTDVKNEKFLLEVTHNIRFRIQATIHKELVKKGIFKF
ncbi:MAG: 1-acyl-sn-glycerol-3-phosphate acyltransferase [Leptospiraceae bacterium]|nr:1-acyl-sn-glycerol-3-phosphate acyltransferase [Leptospiraceae bacterium]